MKNKDIYDVCLILEGTYPFVTGGVSSWVHNLVSSLSQISFTAICILPDSKFELNYKYEIPKNFGDLKVLYLHDYNCDQKKKSKKSKRIKNIDTIRNFHNEMIKDKDFSNINETLSIFKSSKTAGLTLADMIYSKEAWDLVLELYKPEKNTVSFLDYFWTYRFSHLPIFNILNAEIPQAKIYHTVSTGYAGLLGVIAKYMYKNPLILTEHGIYTKERKIEIAQAEWIYVAGGEKIRVQKDLGTFQNLWIKVFDALGKFTYKEAEMIYTIYDGNRKQEILDGANPEKTVVIPNGINIEKFSKLRKLDNPQTHPGNKKHQKIVGLVGRVVAIKDVKTFIRACKIVSLRIPDLKVYILGPTDAEEEYYKECLELTKVMNLSNIVEFKGKVNVMDYYPLLDLITLTSISEAQPLVILEANCAGIPVVATDVGACSELLDGLTEEDKALGPSGIVTKIADPADTAAGIIKLLTDNELSEKMSIAGNKRVSTFYRESDLNKKYLDIYNGLM